MTQQPIPHTARLSSVALAVVLLATLAALALRVHAESSGTSETASSASSRTQGEVRNGQEKQTKEVRQAPSEQEKQQQNKERASLRETFASTTSFASTSGSGVRESDRERVIASTTKALNASLETHRSEVKKTLEAQKTVRATQKALLTEETQARLKTRTDAVGSAMNDAVLRAQKALDVLTGRIQDLETKTGVSHADAKRVLEETQTLLAKTKEDTVVFNETAVQALASATPKENMTTVRSAGQVVHEDVQAVHASLLHAIDLVRSAYTNASSTTPTL